MGVKETVKGMLAGLQDIGYANRYRREHRLLLYANAIAALEAEAETALRREDMPECRDEKLKCREEKPELKLFAYSHAGDAFAQKPAAEMVYVFVSDRGRLSAHAEKMIRHMFATREELLFLYGDEDVWEEGKERTTPWLKAAWSPQLWKQYFYLGSVFAVRGRVLDQLAPVGDIRQLCEQLFVICGGYNQDTKREKIVHIASILFHADCGGLWEEYLSGSYPAACGQAGSDIGGDADTVPDADVGNKLISVVIPSRDNPVMLRRNMEALVRTAGGQRFEIIVVDNGSTEENKVYIEKLKQELTDAGQTVTYLYEPMPFHFSKMCNLGAEAARGEFLLLLNDDVEAQEAGWLTQMAEDAMLPYAGAVGVKLLYPGTHTIQHAGIVNLPMGPVHKLQFLDDRQRYYLDRNRGKLNVLAVTGACLMVRKKLWQESGGLYEGLPVAFNDVDLCYTLYEKGYFNIQRNDLTLYHHESVSRGNDEAEEKLQRLTREKEILYDRHPGLRGVDPYYHIWLNRRTLDVRIVPVCGGEDKAPDTTEARSIRRLPKKLRRHPGLLIRVEECRDDAGQVEKGAGYIQGYAFVAGDDNACYDIRLVLYKEWMADYGRENAAGGRESDADCGGAMLGGNQTDWATPADAEEAVCEPSGELWEIAYSPMLRQDLEDNMPDQKNVALSGFAVIGTGLPAGKYRIGATAKNKITGVTLLNWSNRYLLVK